MNAQAWQQTSFSEPQEPQHNGDTFSTHIASLITNALLKQMMPKAQILSYLVPPISDSGSVKDSNLYKKLMENTVSADSLLKGSIIRGHETELQRATDADFAYPLSTVASMDAARDRRGKTRGRTHRESSWLAVTSTLHQNVAR